MSAMRPSDEITTTAPDGVPDRREPGDRPIVRLHEMTAVILCGGMGTRLREETEFKPKPMVEIGGRPILWHIMKHYHHFGVRNFVQIGRASCRERVCQYV